MPHQLISCVKKIEAKGGPNAKYAWPICISKTGLRPHKRKSKSKTKGGK